jgi:hypothetical protein
MLLTSCAVGACIGSCSGPPVPTPISGEPVCSDFEVGATHTKMRGGLRLPVSVTILDGSEPVMRTTVYGLRTEQDTPTKILLPDGNDEYKVEWGQCENERAPRPASDPSASSKSTAAARNAPPDYECGKANVYKTDTLVTKKGDRASHALTFPPPPKPDCWQGEAPAATPDAGAADVAASADAGPEAADAGVDASAPMDAGTSAADAGKPDAGKPAPKPDGGAAIKKPATTTTGTPTTPSP